MIHNISSLLVNEEEFFKLRYLYQKFILPILVARAKLCSKLEEQVFEISSLYILGFLKHCDIGIDGVECLTRNIGKIKDEKIQQKWLHLCNVISPLYPYLKEHINALIKK